MPTPIKIFHDVPTDLLPVIYSYAETADIGRLAMTAREQRDQTRLFPWIWQSPCRPWLCDESGRPSLAVSIVSALALPYAQVFAELANNQPRGVWSEAHLQRIATHVPSEPARFNTDIETACRLLSDDRLRCGESTVELLAQRFAAQGLPEAPLQACVRRDFTTQHPRTLADLPADRVGPQVVQNRVAQQKDVTALKDGRIVAVSHDGLLSIWTGHGTDEASYVALELEGATFSSVGALGEREFVTLSTTGDVHLWTEKNRAWEHQLLCSQVIPWKYGIQILSDGRLVIQSMSSRVYVWTRQESGNYVASVLPMSGMGVHELNALADGRIARLQSSGRIEVWKQNRSGEWIEQPALPITSITQIKSLVALTHNRLVIGTLEGLLSQWNRVSIDGRQEWRRNLISIVAPHAIIDMAILADNSIAAVRSDGAVLILHEDLHGEWTSRSIDGLGHPVKRVQAHRDGGLLLHFENTDVSLIRVI